tara:strand:- start:1606 stop:1995 length:390 start_codon:yes stop_codon:yes gene_type:complete
MAKISTDISTNIDIECRSGDSIQLEVLLETGSVGSGNYFNISSQASGTIFQVVNGLGEHVISWDTAAGNTSSGPGQYGGIIVVGNKGLITLQGLSTQTNIPAGVYFYTLKCEGGAQKFTVMHGKFKVFN